MKNYQSSQVRRFDTCGTVFVPRAVCSTEPFLPLLAPACPLHFITLDPGYNKRSCFYLLLAFYCYCSQRTLSPHRREIPQQPQKHKWVLSYIQPISTTQVPLESQRYFSLQGRLTEAQITFGMANGFLWGDVIMYDLLLLPSFSSVNFLYNTSIFFLLKNFILQTYIYTCMYIHTCI